MVREAFERELQRLQDEMLIMASMVEDAIPKSVKALKERDMEGSRHLIAQDRIINQRRYQIEADCLIAIATQQPMARDLRVLAAILDITTELERIGDYAKGIARVNLMIGERALPKPPVEISLVMAEKARAMLERALHAFVRYDAVAARAIPAADDEVDRLYNQAFQELIGCVIADQDKVEQANYLLWVAHNLERAADRVTNICERVLFTVTGEVVELDVDNAGVESLS